MTRLGGRPLPHRGPVAQRWERWHDVSRREVRRRNRIGTFARCEGCGLSEATVNLEWHHVLVGRDREPWSSLPEICASMCTSSMPPGCHQKVHRALDCDLDRRVGWAAYERLVRSERFKLTADEAAGKIAFARRTWTEPRHAISNHIDDLVADGWWFDRQAQEFVRGEQAA